MNSSSSSSCVSKPLELRWSTLGQTGLTEQTTLFTSKGNNNTLVLSRNTQRHQELKNPLLVLKKTFLRPPQTRGKTACGAHRTTATCSSFYSCNDNKGGPSFPRFFEVTIITTTSTTGAKRRRRRWIERHMQSRG